MRASIQDGPCWPRNSRALRMAFNRDSRLRKTLRRRRNFHGTSRFAIGFAASAESAPARHRSRSDPSRSQRAGRRANPWRRCSWYSPTVTFQSAGSDTRSSCSAAGLPAELFRIAEHRSSSAMYSCKLSDCCDTGELVDWQKTSIGNTASMESTKTIAWRPLQDAGPRSMHVSQMAHARGTVPAAGEGRSSEAIMNCRSKASLRIRVS